MRTETMYFENICFVVTLLLLLVPSTGAGENATPKLTRRCRENERRALLNFKGAVVDESGILLSSWGDSNEEDCCNWRGISCSNRTGHVTVVNIPSDERGRLSGKISPSLSELKRLEYLSLGHNNFTGNIPYQLGNLTNLRYLDLSYSRFSGSIPEAFGNMVSLETLILAYCGLEGELPKSLWNLNHLQILDLQHNNFNGTLFDFPHSLAANEHNSLQILRLQFNQFTGSLPDYFTRFPSLQELSISHNELSGSFPENIGQASALVLLDLSENQITGPFPNLSLFSSLQSLILNNNKLTDTILEAHFSNLSSLKYLDLSSNSLSFNVSFDWVPPFQLDDIRLRDCTLGPQFPNWLQSQRNFFVLDISGARIIDTIPLWFWDHLPPTVSYLNMSYNKIPGTLPDLSLKIKSSIDLSQKFIATNSVTIDLRSNLLEGPIASLPAIISMIDLSENMFTGSISFLCTTLTPYVLLMHLDLSNNQLSGDLPDCLMNVAALRILNLANNNLSGKIPTSIRLLQYLQILQLRNNNFIGELPSSLMNNSYLQLLDLSQNELSGELPTWIGTHLTSLKILSLHKNEFFGSLPPQICHLRDAQVVDLSRNNLSGSIPNCINNLSSLAVTENFNLVVGITFGVIGSSVTYVSNAVVQWKWVASEYRNTLGLLKLIDFSSNSLVGKIPEEFASLEGLISLNLSSNNLTGNIIPKIGQMKNLEVLDLSKNKLSGEIPSTLASLTFLSVLDLSNNSLTGRIPLSTQLQSFNASVYAGNEELCGLPLPNKCGDPPPPIGHDKDENNEEEDDDDKLAKIGLYVSVVLGFATGFWGLLGPILIRSTWRHAYYRLLDKITHWMYVTTTLNMARLQRKFYG